MKKQGGYQRRAVFFSKGRRQGNPGRRGTNYKGEHNVRPEVGNKTVIIVWPQKRIVSINQVGLIR